MNTNEIATKQDINKLHEKINDLIDTIGKLKSHSPNKSQEEYLTSKEMQETYKFSKSHLSDLRNEGKVPYSDTFGIYLYPKSEIEELVKKGIIRGGI